MMKNIVMQLGLQNQDTNDKVNLSEYGLDILIFKASTQKQP